MRTNTIRRVALGALASITVLAIAPAHVATAKGRPCCDSMVIDMPGCYALKEDSRQ